MQGIEQCPVSDAVRIRLDEDRRVFTPVARSSYVWQDYNDQRSAVERVNSRLAGGFGFERPGIRGLAKMRLRVTMALTIMLAVALGASAPARVSTCGVWSDPPEPRPSVPRPHLSAPPFVQQPQNPVQRNSLALSPV